MIEKTRTDPGVKEEAIDEDVFIKRPPKLAQSCFKRQLKKIKKYE